MKRLIIAEKPSVAQTIAAVLGANKRGDGYLEGKDEIVSWCFGHLAELAGAEAYDEKYAKWRREDLPVIPAHWRYKVQRDKYKQFELLKKLMNRDDVSEIVNGCDAGREGELIFRNVYELAGCKKPILRLWISSLEHGAVEQGFADLKSGAEYENLYAAARCRERADWLVGINATRLFSVLYHRTLNVGRVVSPTLSLIVQRDAEIKAFRPEPFYTVLLSLDGFTAESERFAEKTEAEALVGKCSGTATVKRISHKEKTEKAPALYDLTTLQREANKQLGFTAQQTLDYAQSLYEKKLCTYPRTDSRYLTDDMLPSVNALVLCSAGLCGQKTPDTVLAEQICDGKKVSDHHALIPTLAAGEADLSDLPTGEREILRLIAEQVLRAVGGPCRRMETEVEIECGGVLFSAKGSRLIESGWRAASAEEGTDVKNELPALDEGQELSVRGGSLKEGTTTPPRAYTEASLLSAMETAGVKDLPDDTERKGLGTPATRAGIIEKLISTGFVERKKAKKTVSLIPTQIGISLTAVLPEQLQSPLLTAEWESRLKEVEHGELDAEVFMADICRMVNDLVRTYSPVKGAEMLFPSGRERVGKCPRCGGDVTESKYGFFCEHSECRFGLWKDNKYLSAKKIALTKKMAAELLCDGRTFVKNIFSEKTGKSYDAVLTLTDDGTKSVYALDFGADGR